MDHQKMLDFINKQTKMGLEHVQRFDSGGTVLDGPASPTAGGGASSSGFSNALGIGNGFQAGAANIQAGTNVGQLNQAYTGAQGGLNAANQFQNTLSPQAQLAVNNQNQLASQLALQASGGGPNPAQAALNQNTGQNIAQQAALMAGQRGAGANAGLLATQAAQQGAATQQQAVGQGATLAAQQQLAAEQQQAALANQQISQAGGATQAANTAQQGEQGILQGANTAYNNAGVGSQSSINSANAQTSAANTQAGATILGGALNGGAAVLSNILAKGGTVTKPTETTSEYKSHVARFLNSKTAIKKGKAEPMAYGGNMLAAKGGNVKAHDASEKAEKAGDNYDNDKIPTLLSEGEVVIDRDTLADPGPMGKMARALKAHLEKRNGKKK